MPPPTIVAASPICWRVFQNTMCFFLYALSRVPGWTQIGLLARVRILQMRSIPSHKPWRLKCGSRSPQRRGIVRSREKIPKRKRAQRKAESTRTGSAARRIPLMKSLIRGLLPVAFLFSVLCGGFEPVVVNAYEMRRRGPLRIEISPRHDNCPFQKISEGIHSL